MLIAWQRQWIRNPPQIWLSTSATSPLLLTATSSLAMDDNTSSLASGHMWWKECWPGTGGLGPGINHLVYTHEQVTSSVGASREKQDSRISEVPSNSNVVLNAEEPADIVVQSFEKDKGCKGGGRRDDRRGSRWGWILSRDVKVRKEACLRELSWARGYSVRGSVKTTSPTEKGFRPSEEVRPKATGNSQPF